MYSSSNPAFPTTSAILPTRLTIIIAVSERVDDLVALHSEYRSALVARSADLQFIYVLDGRQPNALTALQDLRRKGEELQILQLGKSFGEAAAISAGFARATGEWIITLPSYYQIAPEDLPGLFAMSESHHMVVARRDKRADPVINRVLGRIFNSIVGMVTGTSFSDLGCSVRLIRRRVLEDISIYGDQHRFLPVLASIRGFSVTEVPLRQSPRDRIGRHHGFGSFLRRLLDLVSVFFLAKFTKKPLRFFGLIGTGIASFGTIWLAWLVSERLFLGQSLGDRPALILATLLLVLGVQLFALGLVGEVIIYAHAREIREYAVEEIV